VVDAIDPARLGRWWAEVLGYRVLREASGEAAIGTDEGTHPALIFTRVDDAKAGKNRLHIELAPDNWEAEVERLVDMGAHRVDLGQPTDAPWTVLADPEGNEFCVLDPGHL
jgi:predicted enzyme related to lactoylglutathione lyase